MTASTIRSHALRLVASLDPDFAEALHRQPLPALRASGLTVVAVDRLTDERGDGGWCDGMSLANSTGLLYKPTPDSRRENFTLLHEYAHRLLRDDDDVLDWLADRPDPARDRETLCDEIAALLLIPDSTVQEELGCDPPTGHALLQLYKHTAASQVACAIALSRHLPCAGAVVLTDRHTHTVAYAAVHGELDPAPRTGEIVHEMHPLRRLAPHTPLRRTSYWSRPWGGARQQLFLDAYATEKRTYAILAVTDLWRIETLHIDPPTDSEPRPPQRHRRCGCGYDGPVTGWPCPTCGLPFCPRCQECDCARRHARDVACTECFRSVPARDVVNGQCSDCRP